MWFIHGLLIGKASEASVNSLTQVRHLHPGQLHPKMLEQAVSCEGKHVQREADI